MFSHEQELNTLSRKDPSLLAYLSPVLVKTGQGREQGREQSRAGTVAGKATIGLPTTRGAYYVGAVPISI